MRILTFDLLERHGARRGDSLLDACCGTGLFLRDWRARFQGGRDVGIDYAWPALPLALDRTKAALASASASELPFVDRAFDAVHSADVLQHMTVAGARDALSEFHRVLRPGGLVALRLRARRRFIPNPPDVDFNHAYTVPLLGGQLALAGFEVLLLRRVNVLPSLTVELAQRLRPVTQEDGGPVKGIALRDSDDWRGRALGSYLALERKWIAAGLPLLPTGHTILAIARKR